MTDIVWFMFSAGFVLGFAYRVWNERRLARRRFTAPLAAIGTGLIAQILKVEEMHRFAGEGVKAVSTAKVVLEGKRFSVIVEREQVDCD